MKTTPTTVEKFGCHCLHHDSQKVTPVVTNSTILENTVTRIKVGRVELKWLFKICHLNSVHLIALPGNCVGFGADLEDRMTKLIFLAVLFILSNTPSRCPCQ